MFGLSRQSVPPKELKAAAEAILGMFDWRLIEASWMEYLQIKRHDAGFNGQERSKYATTTPSWFALQKIVAAEGKLSDISLFDIHLLNSLKEGHLLYDDIMHVLMDHHEDAVEGHRIFDAYPELHEAMPKEFDNDVQVTTVLVEIVNQYRWELENFSNKFKNVLDEGIAAIIKKAK
jgi:hypothetical protein